MIRWVCGLDLGQAADPSAFAGVEQRRIELDGRPFNAYAVRYLERFPIGTPYPDQVDRVKTLMAMPALRGAPVAVDQTGVGRPVVDMLRKSGVKCWLRPITITAGHAVTEDSRTKELTVPKKELVSALQVPMTAKRLWVDESVRERELLGRELTNFKVKVTTSANEVFGAWREGQHDDLVLAVAMAIWLAGRLYPAISGVPHSPNAATAHRPTFAVDRQPTFRGFGRPTFRSR